MRDRPEFDSTASGDTLLTEPEQDEVNTRLAVYRRVNEEPEPEHTDDHRA